MVQKALRAVRRGIHTHLVALILLHAVTSGAVASSHELLRVGAEGPSVVLAQHFLFQLGLLKNTPDGMFGPATQAAVRQFQRERNLSPDGVIGPRTWEQMHDAMLRQTTRVHLVRTGDTLWDLARFYGVSVELLRTVNSLRDPALIRVGQEIVVPAAGQVQSASSRQAGVELLHWSEAQHVYTNFKVATVIDVLTGRSFQVRRFYGTHHADSEPLTARDTQVMREIYGSWSWDRRPIILVVDGRRIAASMNGLPHGQGAIRDNNFAGHFCIHFLGSRIHASGNIDIRHQTAVLEAAGYVVTDLWLAYQ